MRSSPYCNEMGLKKGPWTPDEDQKLVTYIQNHGHGVWNALPRLAGLNRCGKSCRLRWTNYLRPGIKRGRFSQEEEQTILNLHAILGNKWSAIARNLPGRTDNEIKNFWNTNLKKKLIHMGYDPITHLPPADVFSTILPHLIASANKEFLEHQQWDQAARLQQEALLHFLKMPQASIAEANTNSMDMDTINHLCSFYSTNNDSTQFENTIPSPLGTSNLQLVNDSISFSHMPGLQMPCAYEPSSSKDMVQVAETIAFCQGDSSPDSPRLLSCSSITSSSSSMVQRVNNCNASTIWPEILLLEDPLFNEISKF